MSGIRPAHYKYFFDMYIINAIPISKSFPKGGILKMKKFFAVIGMTVSVLCAILLGFATVITGYRILTLLAKGAISLSLCFEFIGIVILLGACAAIAVVLTPIVDPGVKEPYIVDPISGLPYKPTSSLNDPDE